MNLINFNTLLLGHSGYEYEQSFKLEMDQKRTLEICVQQNMRHAWHRYWTGTSVVDSAPSAISMKPLVQDKKKPNS